MKSLKKIVVVIALIVLLLGVTLLFSLKKTSIKGSIINEDIEKISIKYYPFYNIATAESFNELEETGNYIDPVEFDLNSDDLKKVSAIINGLKETDFDFESCNCFYMMDMYELVLNDKYVLSMGDEFGFLKENSEIIFDVPNDLKNIIDKIMLDYNEEKLYKKISSKKISVDIDNNVLNIKDQNVIDTINKYKYMIVNSSEDYSTYYGGYDKYIVSLDNDIKIYLYNPSFAYILDPNGISTFVEFININNLSLYDYIENIYSNFKLGLDFDLNINEIEINYKNYKYYIKNKDKIDKIIEELKYLSYNRYPYLNDMSENDFNENDIQIIIGNFKYYIPGDESWASRFFVDSNGDLYDVSNFNNTILESYVKEILK